ncbi:hypothetical protein AAF712_011996 [Marasmius tenuissimus]|uniref:Uncharacterized protein n=1 Tax=Marasmius tenuissimus TaxID=585030 RepID=A0ABR2ZHL9_9AGAR
MLWVYDKQWPEFVHAFASAIDSPLEKPKEVVCLGLSDKPEYVRLPEGEKSVYQDYPYLSVEDWHKENGVFVE